MCTQAASLLDRLAALVPVGRRNHNLILLVVVALNRRILDTIVISVAIASVMVVRLAVARHRPLVALSGLGAELTNKSVCRLCPDVAGLSATSQTNFLSGRARLERRFRWPRALGAEVEHVHGDMRAAHFNQLHLGSPVAHSLEGDGVRTHVERRPQVLQHRPGHQRRHVLLDQAYA